MKLSGLLGTGSGKLGSSVFSVNGGTQIVRQYQPTVNNPSTDAQVENRSKLKLLSQLGAQVENVIAIRKKGMVSSRNGFTSANYDLTYVDQNEANIALEDIRLTDSSFALPGFQANRSGDFLHVELLEDASQVVDQVVWVILRRTETGYISANVSAIQSTAGADGLFATDLNKVEGDIAVLAYGIRYGSADAKGKYENIIIEANSNVASVLASNEVPQTAASLTETRGLYMADGVDVKVTSGAYSVRVSAVIFNADTNAADSAAGTVTGTGVYDQNSNVTLVATANAGYRFVGWKLSAGGEIIGTGTQYIITADSSMTVYAVFTPIVGLTVTAAPTTSSSVQNASITGVGEYEEGATVSLTAPDYGEYDTFDGWYSAVSGGTKLSTNRTYTFTMGSTSKIVYYRYESEVGA